MSKAAALPSTTSLSPKSARRMLVMYQLEQQANNYLANAIEHQNQQRYDLAEDEFERAARLNNTEAKYRLGLLYCHRKIPNKHHADAIPLWKEAAQAGHLQAQFELAMLLDNGAEGVPSDPPGAFEYFMKGAVADHHLSTHAAGCCFLKGRGVPKDELAAIGLFNIASQQLVAGSMFELGRLYLEGCLPLPTSGTGSLAHVMNICNAFRANQPLPLSKEPIVPLPEAKRDFKRALDWSLKALKAGSTGALHTLGMLYNTEIFASFDPEVAFKYFTKGAEKGIPESMLELAKCYFCGEGCKRNYKNACKWMGRSAEKGLPEAQFYFASWLELDIVNLSNDVRIIGKDVATVPAFDYDSLAHRFDKLTFSQRSEVKLWLEKAAAQNYEPAIQKLEQIFGPSDSDSESDTNASNQDSGQLQEGVQQRLENSKTTTDSATGTPTPKSAAPSNPSSISNTPPSTSASTDSPTGTSSAVAYLNSNSFDQLPASGALATDPFWMHLSRSTQDAESTTRRTFDVLSMEQPDALSDQDPEYEAAVAAAIAEYQLSDEDIESTLHDDGTLTEETENQFFARAMQAAQRASASQRAKSRSDYNDNVQSDVVTALLGSMMPTEQCNNNPDSTDFVEEKAMNRKALMAAARAELAQIQQKQLNQSTDAHEHSDFQSVGQAVTALSGTLSQSSSDRVSGTQQALTSALADFSRSMSHAVQQRGQSHPDHSLERDHNTSQSLFGSMDASGSQLGYLSSIHAELDALRRQLLSDIAASEREHETLREADAVVWDQWSSDSADQSDSEINHDDSELRGGVDDEFDDEAENELSQAPPPFEYNVEEHFADAIKAEPAGQPEKPVAKTIASLDSFLKWMHALEKNGHLLPPSLTPAVDTEQPIDADEEPSQNPEVINAVSAQAEHSATDSSSNVNAAERAWLHAVDAESVLPPMPSQLPSEGIEQLESNQLTVDDLFINRLDDDEDEYGKEIKEAWRLVEMAERRLSMGVSVDDEEGAELREALAAELQETSNNLNESFASSARSSRVASVRASPLTYRKSGDNELDEVMFEDESAENLNDSQLSTSSLPLVRRFKSVLVKSLSRQQQLENATSYWSQHWQQLQEDMHLLANELNAAHASGHHLSSRLADLSLIHPSSANVDSNHTQATQPLQLSHDNSDSNNSDHDSDEEIQEEIVSDVLWNDVCRTFDELSPSAQAASAAATKSAASNRDSAVSRACLSCSDRHSTSSVSICLKCRAMMQRLPHSARLHADAMKEIEKCRQQQQQTAVWLDERQAFMDASVQEFKTQQQALQTEQEKFQRQISEYETARTATENEFHAKQVSLEKELETVKQQAKEVRAFEKEISALAERSNAAQSKADKEAAKNKEIRAKLDKETTQLRMQAQQQAKVSEQIEASKKQIDADRKAVEAERKQLELERKAVAADKKALETDRKQADAQRKVQADAAKAKLDSESAALHKDQTDWEAEKRRQQSELHAQRQQLEADRSVQNTESQQTIADLRAQLDSLRTELQAAEVGSNQLQMQLMQTQSELVAVRSSSVALFPADGVAALREQMELERTEWSMEFNRLLFERQLQSDETAELKNGLQRLKSHCSHLQALLVANRIAAPIFLDDQF